MKTIRSIVVHATLLLSLVGTATAAPSQTPASKRPPPPAIKETVIISDGSPAARREARALEVTDQRLATDSRRVRTAETRMAADRLALARAEQAVALTRSQWDRDVARRNPNAAARDAERHHQALMTLADLRSDLRATEGRDEAVEHDRDRNLTTLGTERVEAKQIMRGDLKADGRR